MELREIKALIALMHEHGLVELEIENKKGKVRLVRGGLPDGARPGPRRAPAGAGRSDAHPGTTAGKAPQAQGGVPASSGQPAPEVGPNQVLVRSPMVGTFYRATSPGAEPLVEEGSHVRRGQPLCIIEAMKMMNEVEAEVAGSVVRILCENGQPVEYGQPLMILDTQ